MSYSAVFFGSRYRKLLFASLLTVRIVDRIIFGRTNYSKEVSAYTAHKHFYNKCAAEVVQFCQERNISYHIKEKTITEE